MVQLNPLWNRPLSPIQNCINNKQSTVPPAYNWYEAKRPVWWLSFPSMQQVGTNYSNSFLECSPPNFDF
ncbi:hypothetical protein TNCV_220831 [Trichonephila clavipes]|nr:hypothetical protein TNCV_220831 [Trichonephila clavipes]